MTGQDWTTDGTGGPSQTLRDYLAAAVAAPSIYNTQPWLFRPADGGVDVFADRRRRLDIVDPRGRELFISLGAAIFNLRVAILARGRQPLTHLLPAPDEPDLVARVTPGPPRPVSATVRGLARAIPRRHTNRRPFAEVPVQPRVLADLAAAARAEGATLTVATAADREAVLGLVRTAERHWFSRPGYWTELAEWTQEVAGRLDGVPPETFGPWSVDEALPLRDFGLVQPGRRRQVARFEQAPTVVVLSSPGDGPAAWLRAGQALERVLLTAAVRGLSSTPMTQPLEIAELRRPLGDPATGSAAQAVLRLGYGPPCASAPRRPLEAVLVG